MGNLYDDSGHFRKFAQSLSVNNAGKYGDTPSDQLLGIQKQQMEELIRLEDEFKDNLLRCSKYGPGVYREFIRYICEVRRNILDARPYFRERQTVFASHISAAFKTRSHKVLYPFHFNWCFISFVLKLRDWGEDSKVVKLAEQIQALRLTIVEMNLPLAISRARIFYSRTPRSHLSHMDLVQIASEGLLSGVDKYCLPFSAVFRSVCIGRAVGNMIENYGSTQLHFYPNDRRKIYRANKAAAKSGGRWQDLDFEQVTLAVNKDAEPDKCTNASEIAGLLAAASHVSAEDERDESMKANGPMRETGLSRYCAPDSWRPDIQVEQKDIMASLGSALLALPIIVQKVVLLKGVVV